MSDGSGLLARVTRDRIAYVYPEPTEDHLWLLADGRVSNRWGDPELTHTCPVGEWCLLQGAIPPTVNVSRIADASRFFVQRSEYTPADGRLILEPRGARSPWDLSPPAPDRGESVGAAGFVGRREGPHFGMFAIENQDDGSWSVLGRAVDTANTPFFSVGERNYVPNTKWLQTLNSLSHRSCHSGRTAPIRMPHLQIGRWLMGIYWSSIGELCSTGTIRI